MTRKPLEDWVTPEHVEIVKLPAPSKYDLEQQIEQRKLELGARYLLHPKNRVRRLDGKVSVCGVLVSRDAWERRAAVRPKLVTMK